MNTHRCKLEAHRGVSSDAPESTLTAFTLAADEHYDMIELDPKFTADNVCIIHHDAKIGRTLRLPDGAPIPEAERRLIAELPWSYLRELDAGSHFAPCFAGERIPTFAKTLAFSRERGIPLKIDNVAEQFTPEQRGIMYRQIREHALSKDIGFTGAHIEYIREVTREFPQCTIHYDGPLDAASLEALRASIRENPLYVWLRYDCPMTAWCRLPPITPELAEQTRPFANIGTWLLTTMEQALDAIQNYKVDIIETNGSIKPATLAKKLT